MRVRTIARRLTGTGDTGERGRILEAAKTAKAQRDWRSAAELYQQALTLRDTFGPRVQLGHMLKEAGDLDAAETAYFEALSQRPNDVDLNVQLGHFYWVKGDAHESLRYYERASELAPEDAVVSGALRIGRQRLADAPWQPCVDAAMEAMRQGRWAAAEEKLRILVDAGRLDYLVVLAHSIKEQGRLNEAIPLYDRYREHVAQFGDKSAYDAEVQYAQALKMAQRFSKAAVHFLNARSMRMEVEGWTGSEDHLMDQIRICIRQVHPAIDPSRIG